MLRQALTGARFLIQNSADWPELRAPAHECVHDIFELPERLGYALERPHDAFADLAVVRLGKRVEQIVLALERLVEGRSREPGGFANVLQQSFCLSELPERMCSNIK